MPRSAAPFDPLRVPIHGTNLIEASAGTGKTWGIAALFTRLVLLKQLPVEQILVVTFTNAATSELKNRLRERLEEALDSLTGRPEAADDFLQQLIAEAEQKEPRERLVLRLKTALSQFDSAAIYTIHGFCQRLLRDYAFYCQAPFDTELSDQSDQQLRTAAEDFWRRRVSHDVQTAQLVFKHKQTPQKMLDAVRSYLNRPLLSWRRPPSDSLTQAQQNLRQQWQAVCNSLDEIEQTFWRIHPNLSGTSFRLSTYQNKFAGLREALPPADYPPSSLHNLLRDSKGNSVFTFANLSEKTKKDGNISDEDKQLISRLGDLLQALEKAESAEQNALTALHLDLLQAVREAMQQHKKTSRERNFDDLLTDVYHALTEGAHAEALAALIADNWQVALIDEFQDTDPLQYEIFNRSFIAHHKPLFLVGDPKQAIYRFRGADIYAYLKAAADADQHYTLNRNFRSHAALVDGIGLLFQQKNRPFGLADIDYAEVTADRAESRLQPPQAPIRVRWLNQADDEGYNKDMLRQRAADWCADEIAGMLNLGTLQQQRLKGQALRPADIAVLVRTNREGSLISRALKQRKVQSVLLQRDSVYATPEAEALAALIGFWLQPQDGSLLRFVLGSVLFEQNAEQLYALNHDEQLLSDYLTAAADALALWQQRGFYAAMQAFAARYHLEQRLLAAGKERSLTNYHQLIEQLAAEDAQSLTPAALHQWLHAQMQAAQAGNSGQEHQLRLESDEALVKIVTMHSSKGLQYPLVYCPFAWNNPKNQTNSWQVLHRSDNSELLAEHQLDETDIEQLADEDLGESLRLLYVALTRAEEQLVIYSGYHESSADNPLSYLLEGTAASSRAEIKQVFSDAKKEEKAAVLYGAWQRFADKAAHYGFQFTEQAPEPARALPRNSSSEPYRAVMRPERRFDLVRYSSFTGLTQKLAAHAPAHEELLPALDAAETERRPTALPDEHADLHDIHHFPRGTAAGLCLHEILENFDFQQTADTQSPLIADALTRYNFDPVWQPAVSRMAEQVARTPLAGGSTLAQLPAENRLAEMGFVLHVNDFSPARLQQWFAAPTQQLPPECVAAARALDFHTLKGFLNGFIDLISLDEQGRVCVIDYKSNHLGDNIAAYDTQAMNEAVAHHHYYLQALIYAVAVARYFAQRGRPLAEVHIRYLFLRGLDDHDVENGIWSWTLTQAQLAEWL